MNERVKRIIALLLIPVMMFSLIGCGKKEVTAQEAEDLAADLQQQYPDFEISVDDAGGLYIQAKSFPFDLDAAENIGKTCQDNNISYCVVLGTTYDALVTYADGKWSIASMPFGPQDVSDKNECESILKDVESAMQSDESLQVLIEGLYSYLAGWDKEQPSEELIYAITQYYKGMVAYGGIEGKRNIEGTDGIVRYASVFYEAPYDYEDTDDELTLYFSQWNVIIGKDDLTISVQSTEDAVSDDSSVDESIADTITADDTESTDDGYYNIYNYIEDCGEIVQYSDLSEGGDFGDVELEERYVDEDVTIYSDDTFYYMLDYTNDKITIAYIN